MALYGVQLDVNTNRVIHNIQMLFSSADGSMSLLTLDKRLHEADEFGNKTLALEQFDECLKSVAIILKPFDLQSLAKYFSRNEQGRIDYHDFMERLR